ncbi:MAG: WbqC family protein [Paludibacter sp.]
MKLGIMQPYFLPYIGYFQLIKAVDKYVIYDDVNFIKGGWINRNRILLNGDAFMINVPMQGASPFKKINEINIGKNREKVLLTIEQAYRKAPYFKDTFNLISDIIKFDTDNLGVFVSNSILKIADFLQFDTEFVMSSEINKPDELKAQDKVLSICKIMGTTEYYNAIGGVELYNKADFEHENIQLHFLKTNFTAYPQFKNEFIPGLSILDVLMFNSKDKVNLMLDNYDLV